MYYWGLREQWRNLVPKIKDVIDPQYAIVDPTRIQDP